MTLTTLPISILQCAVPHVERQPSALARYLTTLARSNDVIPYDQVPAVMQGALSLATLSPFDPNERVVVKRIRPGAQPEELPLLECLLRLNNTNYPSSSRKRWPATPSEFGPHLLDKDSNGIPVSIDAEFVAAALVASGANPWLSIPKGELLPRSIELAMISGFGGLVDRFLDLPGALSAQELADVNIQIKPGSSLTTWKAITSSDTHAGVVEVLLERGARFHNEEQAIRVLSDASPAAVLIISSAPWLELSATAKNNIQSAWKARTPLLEPSCLSKMSASLWGGQAPPHLSEANILASRLLSVGWGSNPASHSDKAQDYLAGLGAPALTARASVKSGGVAGQWSVLAAAAMSRLREASNLGTRPWSVAAMLTESKINTPPGALDCSLPPYSGSLASALGFEWREGIAIDGVVALSLFGQKGFSYIDPSDSNRMTTEEPSIRSAITAFGHATGVGDVHAWAVENACAAADFTLQMLKSPMPRAANCFLHTWGVALVRNREMASQLTDAQKARMLLALTGHFQLSVGWSTNGATSLVTRTFSDVSKVFFPDLNARSVIEDPSLSDTGLVAALILNLAQPDPDPVGPDSLRDQLFTALDGRSRTLIGEALDIIEFWFKAVPGSPDLTRERRAMVDNWRLELTTSPVQSVSSRAMRL